MKNTLNQKYHTPIYSQAYIDELIKKERQRCEEMVEAERERIMAIPTIKGHSRNGGDGDTGLIRKSDIYGDTN